MTPQDFFIGQLFNDELAEEICLANKVCSQNDLYKLGLVGNPVALGKACIMTLPLSRRGKSIGFILLWAYSPIEPGDSRIANVSAVCPGLTRAVESHLTAAQLS
jgi:hypothetical protein